MSLTIEQKDTIKGVMKSLNNNQVVTLGGYAGTGKSTVAKVVIDALKQKNLNFTPCAYTGKATNVLRKKGMHANTIHSTIYQPTRDEDDNVIWTLAHKFQLLENGIDGFLVDEASMVSKEIHEDLISYGLPIIYVGDHGQLEPIGSNFNLMQDPMFKLETVHRNAGEIAHFANHLRQGLSAKSFKGMKKVQIVKESMIENRHLANVDQIICAFNKTRVKLNERVRLEKNLEYTYVAVGERVICLRNNRKQGLFNGMQGIVEKVHKNERFDFVSDGNFFERIHFDENQFGSEKNNFDFGQSSNPFDYAYAITCHKCVHPDTLVETTEGLTEIKSIKKSGLIATPDGPKEYNNFVHNPINHAIKIKTAHGYNLSVTLDHKVEIWNGDNFVLTEARNLKLNDKVRVFLGSQFEEQEKTKFFEYENNVNAKKYTTPSEMTENLAEFLGLMVADGTVFRTGIRLAKRHIEVVERFSELCFNLFGANTRKILIHDTPAAELSSVVIANWLTQIGGLSPNSKNVPDSILKSSVNIQKHFLKGIFEDGWVGLQSNGTFDHIGWFTAYPKLYTKIKAMLLRAGIASSSLKNQEDNIYIYGDYAIKFREQIGFISKFKQNRLNHIKSSRFDSIPICKNELTGFRKQFMHDEFLSLYDYQNARFVGSLSRRKMERFQLLNKIQNDKLKYFYTSISELSNITCESICVEVPGTHRFLQNGFPFSNSQGDEWGNVIVYEQRCDKWDHIRWAYTAASRAKKGLIWAGVEDYLPEYL